MLELHDDARAERRHVSTSISPPAASAGATKSAQSSPPHAPFLEKNVKRAPPALCSASTVGVAVTLRPPATSAESLGKSGASEAGTARSYASGSARVSAAATASTPSTVNDTQRKLWP